ncbi:dienelactone hydrolase family protein [Candidatus Woesearchaeota archaeon]|nr:MAG: dienelactone hydrolase family protein [Candidatus Woesearchaeota archaeon]
MRAHYAVLFLILIACATQEAPLQQPIRGVDVLEQNATLAGEMITFGEDFSGYLVTPPEPGRHPGVILIHEWWGLNDHIKETAEKLATEGYIVLAVDLYNGNVATERTDAQTYVSLVNKTKAVENLRAAKTKLLELGATKIASLGWCFGGGKSLELALSGEEMDATVIYYGTLVTDSEELRKIHWPVLGIFGETDTSIPVDSVNAFDSALDSLNVTNEIYIYPGVGHAFANPSGMNFAPEETKDAWSKTLAFLEKYLR